MIDTDFGFIIKINPKQKHLVSFSGCFNWDLAWSNNLSRPKSPGHISGCTKFLNRFL